MRFLIIISSFLFGIWSVFTTADPIQIEVIVFANQSKTVHDTEWFPSPREEIRIDTHEIFEEPTEISSEFTPKPVAADLLLDIAKKLTSHPNYEVLNHLAWVQEAGPRRTAKAVSLDIEHPETQIILQYLLSGEIYVFEAQRLLHVEVNATYKPTVDESQDSVFLPETVTRYNVSDKFVLQERRQVRINDFHYFDHPRFGVIVHLTRPEEPEA